METNTTTDAEVAELRSLFAVCEDDVRAQLGEADAHAITAEIAASRAALAADEAKLRALLSGE